MFISETYFLDGDFGLFFEGVSKMISPGSFLSNFRGMSRFLTHPICVFM